jgi:alcohol dehydrogenase (cytochrome c)
MSNLRVRSAGSRRRFLGFLSALTLLAFAFITAQSSIDGTWQADSPVPGAPWTLVLSADSSRVYGAVSACASRDGAFEIFDGSIKGESIALKCRSGDGRRTVTLTGTWKDDRIEFDWNAEGEGATPTWMFGASTPRRFVATRVRNVSNAVSDLANRVRKAPNVTFDRILGADNEPQNWLTYSRTVLGWRYSPLTQITADNVRGLELAWLWQGAPAARFQATPLVVAGVLYTVQAPYDVVAIDAAKGHVLWTYSYSPLSRTRGASGGGGRPNRGLAIRDGTLFLGTLDAHLVAIDALTGKPVWTTKVAEAEDPDCHGQMCYVITHAPLIVKDMVLVGVGGGEGPVRGFIAAFDAVTGKERWRFNTVPGPGEPGNQTWSGDSWKTGGGGVWQIGGYDAEQDLTYWGIGNPFPNGTPDTRAGDNLYTDSVVALDADTGRLKWHYQFTPHDDRDWDAAQVPVITTIQWRGQPRKVLLWANRNGIMYVLDRMTGEFLSGKPFVEVNWMTGFDERGRPRRVAPRVVDEAHPVFPFVATNWYPPSYSPRTGLFYIPAWERGGTRWDEGAKARGYGAIRAFDPQNGEQKWEFKVDNATFQAGVLTTASDLLFTGVGGGDRLVDGYFYALDARDGQMLWRMSLAGPVTGSPITYAVNGKQFVVVAAGNTVFGLALRR